jgi:hypothetical protein
LPEVGEFAQTQFITAMLMPPTGPARMCPILGADWERPGPGRCAQTPCAYATRGY